MNFFIFKIILQQRDWYTFSLFWT